MNRYFAPHAGMALPLNNLCLTEEAHGVGNSQRWSCHGQMTTEAGGALGIRNRCLVLQGRSRMKRARMLLVLSLLCSLGFMSACYGAPTALLDSLDRATGINGLEVGGSLYDVEFRVGPATAIWPDITTITTATFWGDAAAAEAAVEAMVDALNEPPMPSVLAETGGAVALFTAAFIVPYSFFGSPGDFTDLTAAYGVLDGGTWDNKGSSGAASASGFYPWASFSASPSGPPVETIPAPSAMALLLIGIASLGAKRRRRKH